VQIAHFSIFKSFPQKFGGSVEKGVGNFFVFPWFRDFSTPSSPEFSTFSTFFVWKTTFSQKDEILHLSLLTRKNTIFSQIFVFQKRKN